MYNSFSPLSEENENNPHCDESNHDENSFDSSSSNSDTDSSTDSQHSRDEPVSKPKFRRLKPLSISCRGLKSKKKQRDLHSVIQQEEPDIICGNESHVDGNYHTSEIFPDNYDIFRNDRNRYGGGVFIGL